MHLTFFLCKLCVQNLIVMQIIKNIHLQSPHQRPFLMDLFYEKNQQAKPVVIFVHGFKGFKDWGHFDLMGEKFAKAGFVFLKFNFSHNGTTIENPLEFDDLEAFGNNNFSKELDDLGVVIDWVSKAQENLPAEEVDTTQINLVGHSRGGGTVILKAQEDTRITKISTWAAVNEFGRYWSEEVAAKWQEAGVQHILNGRTGQQMPLYWQLYEDYQANLGRLHIPSAVKALKIPFLLIHGTEDPAVTYQSALDMHQWNFNTSLLTIKGGDHVFGGCHPWTKTHLAEDLQKVMAGTIQHFSN